jgi:hypothetical protein
MPAHQRLGTDDREHLQDRRKPPIQLDEKPAIAVREQDPAPHLAPQNVQLMPEYHVLRFKPALRLEGRSHDGQDEAEQREHCELTVGDSFN